jgi:hypothetical protein
VSSCAATALRHICSENIPVVTVVNFVASDFLDASGLRVGERITPVHPGAPVSGRNFGLAPIQGVCQRSAEWNG